MPKDDGSEGRVTIEVNGLSVSIIVSADFGPGFDTLSDFEFTAMFPGRNVAYAVAKIVADALRTVQPENITISA